MVAGNAGVPGVTSDRVAAWDGTQWRAMGNGFGASVRVLHVHNGELYAGGDFLVTGGIQYVARWNGSTWVPLGTNAQNGANNSVYAMTTYGGNLVIGGYFPKGIRDGRYKVAAYNGLRSVVVEGESMKKELIALGLRAPVHVIPNFKVVDELWGDAERFRSEKIRFIFISRISESKGFNVIFNALENPVLSHRLDDFTIDFYGPLEKDGREDFEKGIEKYGNCSYSGYLDITNHPADSYRKISGYHVMLFPTYWMGEGFPGVIIDALVCGLPVIASDWNMNREVVTDGRTGRIIPARDADALARMMANVLDNRDAWAKMSSNCHEEARNFDATRVLERDMETAIWP